MAVFNYSGSYSTISPYISSPTNTVAAADLLKIFISPDTSGGGHLITRGIDLIPTFASGKRGMVPAISSDVTTHYLRGDGWTSLWNQSDEDDAVVGGTQNAYLAGALVSAKDIKQWIAQSFVANDAMQFRGVITIGSSDITSSTTNPNGFPTSCKVGDTYKVSGDSTVSTTYIAGQPVTTGDLVVCIKAGTGNSLNTDEYWTIVQNNVERLITVKVNGTDHRIYSQTANNITFYAPTTKGSVSTFGPQVLVSGQGANPTQDAPMWVNLESLKVGEAAKVTSSLTTGNGLVMAVSNTVVSGYDGSSTTSISLAQATTTTIGGIKVGYTNTGRNYKVELDSNGNAYVNVPFIGTVFTDSADGLVPAASVANHASSSATNSTYFLGADAKWYQLPSSAFVGTWRNIYVDGTQKMTNDVTSKALNFKAGPNVSLTYLAPGTTGGTTDSGSADYGTLLINTNNTWRDILVHKITSGSMGVSLESIGNNSPLELDNSDSVFLIGEDTTSGGTTKTTVKAYITWYNMDTQEYELV